jgi:hypothetical protein
VLGTFDPGTLSTAFVVIKHNLDAERGKGEHLSYWKGFVLYHKEPVLDSTRQVDQDANIYAAT